MKIRLFFIVLISFYSFFSISHFAFSESTDVSNAITSSDSGVDSMNVSSAKNEESVPMISLDTSVDPVVIPFSERNGTGIVPDYQKGSVGQLFRFPGNEDRLLDTLALLGSFVSIFLFVTYFLKAWGLYIINKKGGEPYPWLAFVPVVQIYSFVRAGKKDGLWILWIILGFFAFFIPGIILYCIVLHGISKRTGNAVGTTILAFFFPYIVFPIIGHNMVDETIKTETVEL